MDPLKRQLYLIAILAAANATASAQPTQRVTPVAPFGELIFKGANGAEVTADSATIMVPANRRRSGGHSISIPIIRFRGTGPAHTPVIYISGGSGSGIASARGDRFPMFLALREIGDVITFDLRGSNRSRPRVACPSPITDISEPLTYESLVAMLSTQTKTCADSLRASGVDLAGHNIREVVEDIDAIRESLGANKINLVGISTGTQIALEYMRRHPDNVERAILAGVQAPNQNAHMPAEQEKVVRTLAATLRAKGGSQDLVAQLRRALDSLRAHPQHATVKDGNTTRTVGLGPLDLQLIVASTLGDRRQMSLLPNLLSASERNDYTMLATFKLGASKQGITSAFESLMDCQSSAPAARAALARKQAATALLGRATFDFPEVCSTWGVPTLDELYRRPVQSRIPTLLISGTLDGRTPVVNAEDAMRGLLNSVHVVIDGASHGDDLFLSSPEIVLTMLKFLHGSRELPRRIRLVVQ